MASPCKTSSRLIVPRVSLAGCVRADAASAAGYSDQPQLCREARRCTGFSPQAPWRRMQEHEPFRVCRLLRDG